MKQYITVSQAEKELGKNYGLLVEWIENHGYRDWTIKKYSPDNIMINIGQMIHFLSEYYKEIGIGFDDSGVFWRVKVGRRGCGSMLYGFGTDYDSNDSEETNDLITPLWEAVKEVLEKGNLRT